MTTKLLVSNLVTSFKTLLATSPDCVVEAYWRTETPTVLTACVHPVRRAAEEDVAIGNDFQTGWTVNVYVEKPWDNKVATAEAVLDVEEAILGWVNSNREYVASYVLTAGEVPYQIINRPGRGNPTFCAIVPLRFDIPQL